MNFEVEIAVCYFSVFSTAQLSSFNVRFVTCF